VCLIDWQVSSHIYIANTIDKQASKRGQRPHTNSLLFSSIKLISTGIGVSSRSTALLSFQWMQRSRSLADEDCPPPFFLQLPILLIATDHPSWDRLHSVYYLYLVTSSIRTRSMQCTIVLTTNVKLSCTLWTIDTLSMIESIKITSHFLDINSVWSDVLLLDQSTTSTVVVVHCSFQLSYSFSSSLHYSFSMVSFLCNNQCILRLVLVPFLFDKQTTTTTTMTASSRILPYTNYYSTREEIDRKHRLLKQYTTTNQYSSNIDHDTNLIDDIWSSSSSSFGDNSGYDCYHCLIIPLILTIRFD